MGYVKNPSKAFKNSIYHKTTYDVTKPIKNSISSKSRKAELKELDERLDYLQEYVKQDITEEEFKEAQKELEYINERIIYYQNKDENSYNIGIIVAIIISIILFIVIWNWISGGFKTSSSNKKVEEKIDPEIANQIYLNEILHNVDIVANQMAYNYQISH